MNKNIKKFLLLCCIIAVLVIWNGIYMSYLFTDYLRYQPECTLENLLMFIPWGIKEEIIFRYLPFMLATCIYVGLKKIGNKWANISIIPLGILILVVQFVFSSLHIPLDPVYREVLYELPPYPTFTELFETFLLQGIVGIFLCICYLIYISKEKPLSLLQLKSLLACCFVHIVYNQLVVVVY